MNLRNYICESRKKFNIQNLIYEKNLDGTFHIIKNRFGVDDINVTPQELICILSEQNPKSILKV